MIMVHELIRNRKAPKLKRAKRKESVACTSCTQPCNCSSEWVCKECRVFMGTVNIEADLKRFEFSLDALKCDPVESEPFVLAPEHARWLATLDSEYAAELRGAAALGTHLKRVHDFFVGGLPPRWDRPPAAARGLRAQYAQSALTATEKALGVLGSTSVRTVYTAARLAVSGYTVSQLFGDVVLSEEFKAAWGAALRQARPRRPLASIVVITFHASYSFTNEHERTCNARSRTNNRIVSAGRVWTRRGRPAAGCGAGPVSV